MEKKTYQELSKTAEGRKQAWEIMQKEISEKMDAIMENAPEAQKHPKRWKYLHKCAKQLE